MGSPLVRLDQVFSELRSLYGFESLLHLDGCILKTMMATRQGFILLSSDHPFRVHARALAMPTSKTLPGQMSLIDICCQIAVRGSDRPANASRRNHFGREEDTDMTPSNAT